VSIFKLAVHERLYTTKHENFSLRVTASPRPRVHFQVRRSCDKSHNESMKTSYPIPDPQSPIPDPRSLFSDRSTLGVTQRGIFGEESIVN
jgi:hypothetical protein